MVRQRLLSLLVWVAVFLSAASAVALEAGVGRAEITPPLGSPLNGYGDRMGRGAVKVHDPLSARCLYLNDGQTAVFLVTTDLCLITPELRARVIELAPRGAIPQNIILTATHTHSGSGGMSKALVFRAVSGRYVPEVLELTARGIAEAMRVAFETRRPAVIGYGKAEQEDLSVNRRVSTGPVDTQVGVLRVNDAELNSMAVLANFAAHPTTVSGSDKMSISADYCGYFYNELEKQIPGVVAMFANGTEGNQRPADLGSKPGWAATEAVGRQLAQRVAETAATINCGDAILHVGYAEPELPLSMAGFAPRKTLLQTLEINDLVMLFVPGEACVEVGLDLRGRVLARGYAAAFTVGLSNDYVGYLVPPDYYAQNVYENTMNFYGPRVGTWLNREFNQILSRAKAETPAEEVPAEVLETGGPVQRVVLTGSAYEMGVQRGRLFKQTIENRYRTNILARVESGELLPQESWWQKASPYLDVSQFALVVLGIGARPLLQGAQNDLYEELQGMADGAQAPFDALWLVQSLPTLAQRDNADAFFRSSFCTMLAPIGDKAGASDVLVGRNFDWLEPPGDDMKPVIVDVRPTGGRRYLQVGFPWDAGVFTGMNEKGVVVCVERMESLGQPRSEGLPVEFALREVMQSAKTADEAVSILQRYTHLRGYHVLVADPVGPTAYVVELGRSQVLRKPDNGLLLGANPASERTDEAARSRYGRAAKLVEIDHILGTPRLKEVLADQLPGETGMKSIWNSNTRYSVVFEPRKMLFHLSVPGEDGRPGEYVTVSFEGDTSPRGDAS